MSLSEDMELDPARSLLIPIDQDDRCCVRVLWLRSIHLGWWMDRTPVMAGGRSPTWTSKASGAERRWKMATV